jgi:propionyl-CoA carboxylase alpha chain
MKMEHILRAAKASTVKSVSAGVGESLAVDQLIVEFE